MKFQNEEIFGCKEFENHLSDYIEKDLNDKKYKAAAAHALKCTPCHSLLNNVRDSIEICYKIEDPKIPLTGLEARILSFTTPEITMDCGDFEKYLTDYLDGFFPAMLFHRWERHSTLCEKCTNLPNEVIKSISACHAYKANELPLSKGLHNKILEATIGTGETRQIKSSYFSQAKEWLRGHNFPISTPRFVPVAMTLLFALFVFGKTMSADGSIGSVYQKSFELASQTYQKGANIVLGKSKSEHVEETSRPNRRDVYK